MCSSLEALSFSNLFLNKSNICTTNVVLPSGISAAGSCTGRGRALGYMLPAAGGEGTIRLVWDRIFLCDSEKKGLQKGLGCAWGAATSSLHQTANGLATPLAITIPKWVVLSLKTMGLLYVQSYLCLNWKLISNRVACIGDHHTINGTISNISMRGQRESQRPALECLQINGTCFKQGWTQHIWTVHLRALCFCF